MKPQIRFCSVGGGQRIAFAVQGSGPVLLCPPWWVSHVENDWEEPKFKSFFERLAERFTVVRYDRPGVGLSDRERSDFSLEREVTDLEALADHLGAERFALFGMSCGGPPAVTYAARHPARVSRMVLYGSYAHGLELGTFEVREAMLGLVRAHWGLGSKALSDIFAPDLTAEESRRMSRAQRVAASGDMAARLLQLTYEVDVRGELDRVGVPVLVIHRRNDRAIPFEAGRELAAHVAGASLTVLDGKAHAPWFEDAEAVLGAALAFLGAGPSIVSPRHPGSEDAELARRGDVWTVGWRGRSSHVKHTKGLTDIATLVQNPGVEIAALDLVEGKPRPGLESHAQSLLDDRARREYRSRLDDLEIELVEADAQRDLGRAEKLRHEREGLLSELESATGLGARHRAFANEAERARKAVTARIRDAIGRINEVNPELARHLDRSITTGLNCAYKPEERVTWRT